MNYFLPILHLSIHSFTPVLNGKVREAEFGILYDPKRILEKKNSGEFKKKLKFEFSQQKIRSNYPYLGKADGITSSLRKIFPEHYLGIEVEINQKLLQNKRSIKSVKNKIHMSLKSLLKP